MNKYKSELISISIGLAGLGYAGVLLVISR